MMHARDQSIFLYLGSIMVACRFEANGIELDKLTDIFTLIKSVRGPYFM